MPADVWYPQGVANHAPQGKWLALTSGPNRGVLHTTETDTFKPGSTFYGGHSWPHCTLTKDGTVYNHIPLNYGSPTLKNAPGGVATNTLGAVQIEIVARAGQIDKMPQVQLDALKLWMRWVEKARGVQRLAPRFVGAASSPARVNAPQRFNATTWNGFNGWCGHQHVPENDHWDPGAIDIDFLLAGTLPAPTPEGFLMALSDAEQYEVRDRLRNIQPNTDLVDDVKDEQGRQYMRLVKLQNDVNAIKAKLGI